MESDGSATPSLWNLIEDNKAVVTLLLLILVLVGGGILFLSTRNPRKPEISLESAQDVASPSASLATEILVDVSGAVKTPGVYRLGPEARVGEAVEMAGGFATDANASWVAKNLNLAQKLEDGAKLYIPFKDENPPPGGAVAGVSAGVSLPGSSPSVTGKISINRASVTELDSLWGVGEKRAQGIVAGRPYIRLEELTEKKILPANVFEKIKDQISL